MTQKIHQRSRFLHHLLLFQQLCSLLLRLAPRWSPSKTGKVKSVKISSSKASQNHLRRASAQTWLSPSFFIVLTLVCFCFSLPTLIQSDCLIILSCPFIPLLIFQPLKSHDIVDGPIQFIGPCWHNWYTWNGGKFLDELRNTFAPCVILKKRYCSRVFSWRHV